MHCAIYSAQLVNGLWENPQQMSSEINQPNTTNTHPQWAFWKEQEGLFFTSNRKGGWGGMDIWFAPKEGVATNLGGTINTTGDEVTPFIIRLNKSYISVLIFIQELVGSIFFKQLGKMNGE